MSVRYRQGLLIRWWHVVCHTGGNGRDGVPLGGDFHVGEMRIFLVVLRPWGSMSRARPMFTEIIHVFFSRDDVFYVLIFFIYNIHTISKYNFFMDILFQNVYIRMVQNGAKE